MKKFWKKSAKHSADNSGTLYKYTAFLEKGFPPSPEAMEDEGRKENKPKPTFRPLFS